MQQLADIHPSAPPLKGISDYDVELVQRLLYYTRQDLWLSESDKDWHYPLLITLREKDWKNWRNRSIEAWEARWEKGAQQEERQMKKKQDNIEHCFQCGIPVLALGRQRLALLGALPSGAGPKAQMSRVSVLRLSLK